MLFKFLNRESNGLQQAAILLAVSTVGAQLLALVRDRLLASHFGAGETLDVYYAAFRIPDIIFIVLGSIASSAVIVPILSQMWKGGRADVEKFLNNTFSFFLVAAVLISALTFLLIPYLSNFLVPGFSHAERATYVLLSRILLLSPIFIGLSSLLASVTQSLKRFLLYSLSPILYNLGIIAGIVFLYPAWGLSGLVWGVVVGSIFHMAIQIPAWVGSGIRLSLRSKIDLIQIKKLIYTSLPRTLTLASGQLTFLGLVSIASFLEKGSITIFNFSYNLQTFTTSVIGMSYAMAAFPVLADLFSSGERSEFLQYFSRAARSIIFWVTPATALFIVLRAQVVRAVLGAGRFDWTDTRLTAASLAIFAVSTISQNLILLFLRGFYSAGKTAKPFYAAMVSAVVTVASAVVFLKLFSHFPEIRYFFESLLRVNDLSGTPILMLALAFSLGSLCNLAILWYLFTRDFGVVDGELKRSLKESFYAAVVIGAVAYGGLSIFGGFFNLETFWGIFLQGLLAGICGLVAGWLLLKLFKNEELADIEKSLHSRFFPAKNILLPEKEEL